MIRPRANALWIRLIPAFFAVAISLPSEAARRPCIDLLGPSTDVDQLFDRNQVARGGMLEDRQFVSDTADLLLKYVAKIGSLNGYLTDSSVALIKKLGKDPANYELLRPSFEKVQKALFDANSAWNNGVHGAIRILGAFCTTKAFSKDIPELFEKALEAAAHENSAARAGEFIAIYFKNLKDARLRGKIVDTVFAMAKDGEQRPLFWFMKMNAAPEFFRRTPIVLGVDDQLERLGEKIGGASYGTWGEWNWVNWDSKSIPLFRKTFRKVAPEAESIHFAVGVQIADLDSLREQFSEIRAKGNRKVLEELSAAHEGYEGMTRIRLGRKNISITNLELYWILEDPELLAKTTFYERDRPISEAKRKAMLEALLPLVGNR